MGLTNWWMLLIWAGLISGIIVYLKLRKSNTQDSRGGKATVPVAHSNRLTNLAAYEDVLKRYRLFVRLVLGGLTIVLLSAVVLSARPVAITIEQPNLRNRDILLCLDVSGSMTTTDGQLLATFANLAKDFKGERLGLTLFDSSSSNAFPLTDDYPFIQEKLKTLATAFASGTYSTEIFAGTAEGEGSSLIGDGLASCVLRFDNLEVARSRSIILATDNYANGQQIINLTQAGALAKKKSIRVYGVNPSDFSTSLLPSEEAKEFHDVVLSTEGGYYKIDYEKRQDSAIVTDIVKQITNQEATRFKGAPQVVQSDIPLGFIIIALVAASVALVVLWRLHL